MISSTQIMVSLVILGCMVLLGDEKQSIVFIVSVAATICLYIYDWYKGKKKYVIATDTLVLWLLLGVSFILSSIHSLSRGYSFTEGIKYINAFLLFVYFSNKTDQKDIHRYATALYYWTIVILVISYMFVFFPIFRSFLPLMNLLYKSYDHSHVVDVLIFTTPLWIYMLKQKKDLITKLSVLFLASGLLTSYARGAILLILIMGAIFGKKYLHGKYSKQGSWFLFLSTVLSIGALVYFTYGIRSNPISGVLHKLNTQKMVTVESRMGFWKQAITSIKTYPLFGQGPGTFYLVSKKFQSEPNSYSWFAHSFPLQSVTEMGLLGFIILFLLLYKLLFINKKGLLFHSALNITPEASLLHGIILVFLYSFFEMNMDFTVVWVLFWSILGMLNQVQNKSHSSNKKTNIHVIIPLVILSVFYVSAILGSITNANHRTQDLAVMIMPYDANIVGSYLEKLPTKKAVTQTQKKIIRFFHAYNSSILVNLASAETDPIKYDDYMKTAIESDPQNRSNLETYITYSLKNNRDDNLQYIVKTMAQTISVQKQKDQNYIETRWKNIHNCFNSASLIWNDSPYVDTYQAKSLYFASLCLIKEGNFEDGKRLMEIAVNAKTSWSNIYIDYAAIIWWNEGNYAKAKTILKECEKNENARNHCSQFDNGQLSHTSVQDKNISFIK